MDISNTNYKFLIFHQAWPPVIFPVSVTDNCILPGAQGKRKKKILFLSCFTHSLPENSVASLLKIIIWNLTTALLPHVAIPPCPNYCNYLLTHPPASTIYCLYFLYFSQSQIISLLCSRSSNWEEGLKREKERKGYPGKTRWFKDQWVLLRS